MPRILIVDSDLNIGQQLQPILAAEGFDVLVAVSGQGAVAMAQMNKPSLILLDVQLPDADGFEVCRSLRTGGAHNTAGLRLAGRGLDRAPVPFGHRHHALAHIRAESATLPALHKLAVLSRRPCPETPVRRLP